ncbi:hypothetical protein [Pseudorhodobacter sp. E13]|uniref:hypothetical protein n=1 Tax=Pseudorhodobacter sp. E13 TaxID=2487931 RepID=UPI000F8D0B26|nr:hypothetical protein [Pseudorhodobacter sp. E13]
MDSKEFAVMANTFKALIAANEQQIKVLQVVNKGYQQALAAALKAQKIKEKAEVEKVLYEIMKVARDAEKMAQQARKEQAISEAQSKLAHKQMATAQKNAKG